mmetsp:Transcript_2926/g.5498  ORF Transcript_2926/g.5498 Transcript_2926/m.5498 type:complete len:95 (+) Transcript_2926:1592-1876(+)
MKSLVFHWSRYGFVYRIAEFVKVSSALLHHPLWATPFAYTSFPTSSPCLLIPSVQGRRIECRGRGMKLELLKGKKYKKDKKPNKKKANPNTVTN